MPLKAGRAPKQSRALVPGLSPLTALGVLRVVAPLPWGREHGSGGPWGHPKPLLLQKNPPQPPEPHLVLALPHAHPLSAFLGSSVRFGSPPGGGRAPSLQPRPAQHPRPEGGCSRRGLRHPRCPRGWSGSRRRLQHAGVAVGRSAPTPQGRRSPRRPEHPHPKPFPSHQRCCQCRELLGGRRQGDSSLHAGLRCGREAGTPGRWSSQGCGLCSHRSPTNRPQIRAWEHGPPALHVPPETGGRVRMLWPGEQWHRAAPSLGPSRSHPRGWATQVAPAEPFLHHLCC